jgi:WD40 repeat protein
LVFGHANPALAPAVSNGKDKDGAKRRKPKNSLVKSSSTFISRVIPHEGLKDRLQDHAPEGLFAFANINRAFQWLDLSSPTKVENLTKILFTKSHALCHDVNQVTKSASHLDVVIGFNTGDIIWYEPITQKYSRLNKNACISGAAVSDVRWMPGSENLFLAACMDGTLIIYDKEKEDAPFVAEEDVPPTPISNGSDERKHPKLKVLKSVTSKNQKTNPVAYWKLSNQKPNAFAFSPSGSHLAIVSEDGCLRIIDIHAEKLLDVYSSYYGGVICVCWSPDGQYILTGGQDDLISIWSWADGGLVARCQGHQSWVTDVAFDLWRCDGRNYRFGSVGEDSKLLLWDFSVGMLHRPRAASVRQVYSGHARSGSKVLSQESLGMVDSYNGEVGGEEEEEVVHALVPRRETAMLPPVMARSVDEHGLSWLGFEEDAILTACRDGEFHCFRPFYAVFVLRIVFVAPPGGCGLWHIASWQSRCSYTGSGTGKYD